MVDYDYNGTTVSNFRCYLADWGTANYYHPGGTPMYAGPKTFRGDGRDLFSFGRLALELFLEPQGKMNTLRDFPKQTLAKYQRINLIMIYVSKQ